jgi:hypothetical protein
MQVSNNTSYFGTFIILCLSKMSGTTDARNWVIEALKKLTIQSYLSQANRIPRTAVAKRETVTCPSHQQRKTETEYTLMPWRLIRPRQVMSILAKPLLLARVIGTLNSTILTQCIPEPRIPDSPDEINAQPAQEQR